MNINIEKILKVLEKGKKIVLTRALPAILSATAIGSAMIVPVKAAGNDTNTISATEIYNSDNAKVAKGKQMLDEAFDKTYSLLANGGLNLNNNVYRFLAEMSRIKDYLDLNVKNDNYTDKTALQNYYNEKLDEAKIVFSNMTGTSIDIIKSIDKQYDCDYVNSLSNNGIQYVAANKMSGSNIIATDYYTYDDSKLGNTNYLIVLPSIASLSSDGSILLTYTGIRVSKSDKDHFDAIQGVIDATYEKLENAINKGNYDITSKMSKADAITSIDGDTNLANSGIRQKYTAYTTIKTYIDNYLSLKKNTSIINSWKRNKNKVSYNEYKDYATNGNYTLRYSEENGKVYYRAYIANSSTFNYVSTTDKGIIKTSDLSNGYKFDNQVSNNITSNKISVQSGVNIRIDGVLFKPTNVNGEEVESFIFNGTTWVPARPLANAYGCTIYPNTNGDIVIDEQNEGFYTYDSNGNPVYCVSNSAINVNSKVNTNLTAKTLTVSRYADIVFNGEKVTLYDSKGNPVKAMVINGTTYIPAKSFTNLFNCGIGYNSNEHTALLTRYTYTKTSEDPTIIPGTDIELPEGSEIVSQTVVGETEGQPYYIDQVTGQKVYIDEGSYQKIR